MSAGLRLEWLGTRVMAMLRYAGRGISILVAVSVITPSVLGGSDQPVAADADGWPLRYPVVECGRESRTVFVEVDPSALPKTGPTGTKGAIIPHGTRRIIYTIVDMQNATHSQTQEETDQMMGLIEAYWERISHGRLDIEITSGGRVSIPFSNSDDCPYRDWSSAVDEIVGRQFDLFQFDGRVYFLPGVGTCGVAGRGTLYGNSELPIYTGGFANQSWIMSAFDEFTVAHEIGHNFGLHHGSTPSSSQQSSEEYGDQSTIMGGRNPYINPSDDELRGLHGVNRVKLGWLEPLVEMKPRVYTLHASEFDHVSGLPALAIPHPWYGSPDDYVFFLTYRNGSDGMMVDGSFAPLRSEYTQGVGIRLADFSDPDRTYLYRVLRDGEYFDFPDPNHQAHGFFWVQQISHNNQTVTFEVGFTPLPSEESLAAGTCNNGLDDDGDLEQDHGGGTDWTSGWNRWPEGIECMMTWDSIVAPASVEIGSEFFVVCQSESPQVDGFGPLGVGQVSTVREPSGMYVGVFDVSTCGAHTFTCGTEIPGTFVRDHIETTVEVVCPPGRFCDAGVCVTHLHPPQYSGSE